MTGSPESLRNALEDAICNTVSGKEVAIAFSGGLDSGVVAAIAKRYARSATLYTVGTDGSHDLTEAKASAEELGIKWVQIRLTEGSIIDGLRKMISITGTKDIVTLSFELPLFFVCMNCSEEDVIGGQGADELFAGYSKYVSLEESDLKRKTAEDMKKLNEITLPHEKKVAEHFGKRIHHPFLDEKVMKEAGSPEPPSADSRKMKLKEVSESIGYPSFSAKGKRSAQYSSGAMKLIKKICRDRGVSYAELVAALSGDVT